MQKKESPTNAGPNSKNHSYYNKPRFDTHQIKAVARGRWPEILSAMGATLPERPHLHHPCPGCGGRDRFRFDDRGGDGTFICGRGGDPLAGDGFDLLEHVLGWSFRESLPRVAEYLGVKSEQRRQVPPRKRYEGVDYRDVPAVSHAWMVLQIAKGDRQAGRPIAEHDRQAVLRAKGVIEAFRAQGGLING